MPPLLKKLRFKPGMRVYVTGAPSGYEAELAELASEVERSDRLSGKFDLIHAFYTRVAQVKRDAPKLARSLEADGILWISYPKGKQLATDISRDVLHASLAADGLDGVSLVALDETWSAMRFKTMAPAR